jgi:hypothetical protein
MTEPVPHYVYAEDTATAVESCVVDGRGNDGSAHIAIDRADVDLRVASADLSADGLVSDHIVGSAPGRDIAELRVAQYLVSRLNQLSNDDWLTPELVLADARQERGVDCITRKPSGEELQIQVTTTEREVWQRREDIHERSADIPAVVEAIWSAIQAKRTRADRKIVLALDATDSPRASFRPVIDEFRTRYGDWALHVGFQEIWLVGPSAALVNRLDVQT